MADLKDLASRYGVLKDKLNAQDFGPNDSIIASSLMHPQEAAGRASDWLQEKMRIAAGIPNQALEDEGSWYQTGIVPSMNEQAQAGLDLAGLMQTGAMPFAPASAGGTLGMAIKAYHGTPHLFDRFDMSKIGTGTGAQAYGEGLYFAQDPKIAKRYMTAGVPVDDLKNKIFLKEYNAETAKIKGDLEKHDALLQEAKDLKSKLGGHIYETSIRWPNAEREATDPLGEHHLMDWDKSLEDQSDYVKNILKEKDILQKYNKDSKVADVIFDLQDAYPEDLKSFGLSPENHSLRKKEFSKYLDKAGIPGLKHQAENTSNYVMFGDEYPEIIKRAGSLDELQEKYAEGGIVKAQNQNENLGKLAEMLGSARDVGNQYTVPSWVPLAGGVGAGDLLMGKTPEEIENWSYGNAPMQIPEMSNVPQFKRGRAQSLADALTTLAPGVKATEGLPAGLSFIGPKSKNWDKVAAELAAKKLDEGADPAEVWREHLIGRMPDKTLFSEISDKDANLLTPRDIEEKIAYQKTLAEGMKAGIKERNASLKVQPDLFEKDIKSYNKQKKADADLMLNEINRNFGLQDYLPMYEGVEAGQGTFSKNVYTHPELFENYPKLGESVTRFGGQSDKFNASFTPNMGGGNIEIYYPSVEAGTKNSVMAHELQHAIQGSEGWGRGGNTDQFTNATPEMYVEKETALKNKILSTDDPVQKKNLQHALKLLEANKDRYQGDPYLAYRRLTGEAQARATQDRLDMDMAQRRENYPLAGGKLSDIPLEDLIYKYEGNGPSLSVKKPIKNLNQALLDKYIERGYLPEDELVKYEKNAAKMRNTGRQDINIQNAQANPEYEAYKAEYDVPFMHGTERLDRVLSKEGLDPKRATSGPMLYGTDSPEIASSYAKKKKDTSMINDDDWDYSKAFTVSPQQLGHRGTIPYTVEQSWNHLDPEVKRDILTKAPRVGYSDLDQWQGDFVLHPEGEGNAINQSHYDYLLKQSRNNPIKAMRDYWLDSGNLFNEEEKMSQLYRLAGYPHEISQEMAPWTKREGVLTGVSRITKPLDTSNVDDLRENVIPALKQAFKNDKSRKKDYGADSWDKNTRYTPKEWVNELESDLNKGENSYVWTSIPDKITSELKRLGYNGIYDTGGKSAGADSHQVTIPFNPSQIRSKFAAFDPILKNSSNLLAGTALGSVLLRDDDQGYAEGGSVVGDLPFNDPDQLRLYHQAMQHYDDVMENTGASKKMGKTEARINYNTTTKGDRERDKDLHTLIADYGVDVGKGVNLNATMIKPMEAEGVYLGNLTGSVPVGEGRASLGLQGLHTKYNDDLSGYTAGYNGKVGNGNLSASYFEPADHNSAGRQVQLEYSMPFADGGSVSEFKDPAHERLYRRAMAHFDNLVNA